MTTIPLPTVKEIRRYISIVGRENISFRCDKALYKCIMAVNSPTLVEKLARQKDAQTVYESATNDDRIVFIKKMRRYL